MNDKEVMIFSKVQAYLEKHGQRTTEFVKKAIEQLKDIPEDEHTEVGNYPIYDGDTAIIIVHNDEIAVTYKNNNAGTIQSIIRVEKTRFIRSYAETMVTNAEQFWVQHNRSLDSEVIDQLVSEIERNVRLMNDAATQIDFIVNKHNARFNYSDKAKEMFGI